MSVSGSVSLDSLGVQGVNGVSSTRPKPLHTLESPIASPTLTLIWQQGAAGIENFSVDQLRGALLELITVHRHASSRAKSLSAQLLELGGATQNEKHQQMLNLLHTSRAVNVEEGFAQFSAGQNNKRSFDESLKRKREDKKKRDKERKRKKKKRSGTEEKETVKSPSSLWKSMDDYLRFPTLNDLDLLSNKVRDSMYSIPTLGRHFSEVWREYDEKMFPNKKKRKSYHTISRRFRPKSDLMAIPDLPLRKLVKGVDDQLRPKKVFQVHSLAQRVLAAVMPLPGVKADASNSSPPSIKHTNGDSSSLETAKPPSIAPVAFAPVVGAEGSDIKATSSAPTSLKAKSATVAKTSLEERVRLELRFLGLVPSTKSKKVDFTKAENRSDDDIASLLRQLQSQLRRVSQANRSRCQKILTAAAPMVGADKDLLRLHHAEQALEKIYSSRKASWDDNAVIRAIENVDTALKMYKGLPVLSQTGTFYVPKPSDFAGMPRNRIHNDSHQKVRSSSSHDPLPDAKKD